MSESTSGGPSITVTRGVLLLRAALVIAAAVALYLLGRTIADQLIDQFDLYVRAYNEPLLHRAIMTATAVYILLMATPFMPGVEIGLSMLMVFGARIAFLVYVSTVLALLLAYLIGRFIPPSFIARTFAAFGLVRAEAFINRMSALSAEDRLALLVEQSPTRVLSALIRHRFVALAVVLNVPGNVVIGGGGGIALIAGMSRLFPLTAYSVTILIAVAPVPLVITLTQ